MSVDAVPGVLAEAGGVLTAAEVRFCVETVNENVYRALVPLAHAVGMRDALTQGFADWLVLPTGRGDVHVAVRHVVAFWTEPVE